MLLKLRGIIRTIIGMEEIIDLIIKAVEARNKAKEVKVPDNMSNREFFYPYNADPATDDSAPDAEQPARYKDSHLG